MKAIHPAKANQLILVVVLFCSVLLCWVPQTVEAARPQREIAMSEGDPVGGWTYDGGGGGGGGVYIPPPEDGAGEFDSNPVHWFSDFFPYAMRDGSMVLIDLIPQFEGNTIVWTISFIDFSVQGGER